MNTQRLASLATTSLFILLASMDPPRALAAEAAASAPSAHLLGAGLKAGNGIGFMGADLIIMPLPRIALDLQVSYASVATDQGRAHGYGLAPALQFRIFDGNGSSPYVAVGAQYVHLALQDVQASAKGVFANAGYEWRWPSGLALLLGGGIQRLTGATATNGVETVSVPGRTGVNIEFGVRYLFF